jgi:hypothetical protein
MAYPRVKQILIGTIFGRLTVISDGGIRNGKHRGWVCRCSCGNIRLFLGAHLRCGNNASCGCWGKEALLQAAKDHAYIHIPIGTKFGRWTVIADAGSAILPQKRGHYWLCRCKCGIERKISGSSLASGGSKSCGCLVRDEMKKGSHRRTHGGCGTPEYGVWNRMLDRCRNVNNKSYKHYGGRGIKVCDRWLKSFSNFLADMGVRPSSKYSIDRIYNNGNYEPNNCRWATQKQQIRNTRNVRYLTINGKTKILKEWAEIMGIDRHTLHNRIASGQVKCDTDIRECTT